MNQLNKLVRFLLGMIIFLFSTSNLSSQCSCTNCPLVVGNNTVVTSDIIVSGLTNPTLGSGGQGICGIELHFETDAIQEIEVTLTTPSGQSIILIDRISGIGINQNLVFDILFLPCNQTAVPDAGFPAQFTNSAYAGLNNLTFNGSYYPGDGTCLESLTGDANGTYTLTIEDFVPGDPHTILDWEIIFCDGSGTSCGPPLSCDPGEITSTSPSSITECEGDPALNLNSLSINWNGSPPDPALYGITYFIQDNSGNVLERTSAIDLTSYSPGNYTICAMSYLIADEPLLPSTSGGYNISQVESDIQNDLYCANLDAQCTDVTIEQDYIDPIVTWPVPAEICEGVLVTFPISNYDPSATYLISISSGSFSFFSFDEITGTIELIANAGAPITICASIDGDCQQGTDCASLDVLPGPIAPILDGPSGICNGDNASISVSNYSGTEVYNWTISGPGVIVVDNNENVEINAFDTGTITICAETSSTCGLNDGCISIEVSDPTPPTTNADPTYCMPGDFFNGNANGSSTSILWTQESGPGTITFVNPNVVATQWTVSQPGIYTVRLTKTNNGCVTFVESTFEVLPAPPPIIMNGPTGLCSGDGGTVDLDNPDLTLTYSWSISGPGVITADNTTSVDFLSNGSGNIEICVDVSGPCGTETECYNVTINEVQPPTNLSSAGFCMPGGLLEASANGPISSSQYTQLSGPGTIVFVNPTQLTTDFIVDIPGTYTIELTNTFMGCTESISYDITVNEIPNVVSSFVCADGEFTVELTFSGGQAPYFVDGILISGNTFVSSSFPSGTTVTFNYLDDNGCGDQVLVQEFCPCVSDAGSMDITPIEICGPTTSATGVHNNNQILDGNDTQEFILHTLGGNSLGTIIDQNLTGTFSFLPSMVYGQTYYISLVVGNDNGGIVDLSDACLSVSEGTPVTWFELPTIILPTDLNTCDASITIPVTASPISSFFWDFASNSPNTNGTIDQTDPSNIIFTANESGDFILEVEATSTNGCISTDQVSITKYPDVIVSNVIETCNEQTYSVSFDIVEGTPSFFVNGSLITGSNYLSPDIPSGASYNFLVEDSNGCFSNNITGIRNCDCESDAGSMSSSAINVCDTIDFVQGLYNNDGNLDSDDLGAYYLHTNNGPTLGTIIDFNNTGLFSFISGLMNHGQTYYISYVVGNDDGSGSIDLQDPCLDVSVGQPVIWNALPSINFESNYFSCLDTIDILLELSTINYILLEGPGVITFSSQVEDTLSIAFSESGDYLLEFINSLNGCQVSDTAVVTIGTPISNVIIYDCSTVEPTFDATLILNGDGPFLINQQLITDTIIFTDLPIDTSFSLIATDNNECISEPINISTTCDCIILGHVLDTRLQEVCISEEFLNVDTSQLFSLNDDEIGLFYVYEAGTDPFTDFIFTTDSPQIPLELPLTSNTLYGVFYASGLPNNQGILDLDDNCTSVSNVQPFTFYLLPVFQNVEETNICESSFRFDRYGNGFEYEFILTNAQNATIQFIDSSAVVTSTSPGEVNVKVLANGICSDSMEYTLNFLPQLILDSLSSRCMNSDSFQITAHLSGGTLPYFINGNSYNEPIINLGSFVNNTVVDLIITDASDCESITSSITSDCSCITYDFNLPDGLCNNETIDLSTVVSNSYPTQWEVQSGDALIDNGVLIINNAFEGNLELIATPLESSACDSIYEFVIEVEKVLQLELTQDQSTFCSSDEIDFDLNNQLTNASLNNGTWISQDSEINIFNNSILSLGGLEAGVYEFLYVSNEQLYCPSDSVTYIITKFPQAEYLITSQNPDCFDEGGIIAISSENGSIVSFNIDGEQINGLSVDDLIGGVYQIELTDINACTYNETVTIIEPEALSVSLVSEEIVNEGVSNLISSEVTGGEGPYSYQWILNGEVSNFTSNVITISLDAETEIQIIVTDINGCTAEDILIIGFNEDEVPIELPNILSLSSDLNSNISIPNYRQIAMVESWVIFDRWGNKVFNASNFDPSLSNILWDGTKNGQAVESGVYVYHLIFQKQDGSITSKSGDITVIR